MSWWPCCLKSNLLRSARERKRLHMRTWQNREPEAKPRVKATRCLGSVSPAAVALLKISSTICEKEIMNVGNKLWGGTNTRTKTAKSYQIWKPLLKEFFCVPTDTWRTRCLLPVASPLGCTSSLLVLLRSRAKTVINRLNKIAASHG